MGAFIMRLLNVDAAHARRVQKQYFHAHGTTMAGLMRHHGVHPEDFLLDVHNIALDRLTVDTRLRAGLERLPGRKLVFTNADAASAARVLAARGIRSEEHTSELQSLMRTSYAVSCLNKKINRNNTAGDQYIRST